MTPSELKYNVQKSGENTFYFDYKTMRFFGDTMKNYGVRQAEVNGIPCWELYRKKTVKHGARGSAFFCQKTFKIVHKKTR